MPTLIIITDRYPLGCGEAFVADEIRRSTIFERIIVVPTGVDRENISRPPVSTTEEMIPIQLNRISFIKKTVCVFTALFSGMVWEEILLLFRTQRFCLKNVQSLLSSHTYGRIRTKQVLAVLSKLHIENDNVLVQAYWLHIPALVAISVAKKYRVPVTSRCHRCDVYENESKFGYIPFRKYILENLDKVFCISQDAIDFLSKTYPKYKAKYKLARLGSADYGEEAWKDSKTVRLVSCSYLTPVKRVELIIKGLAEINDISVNWVHYGNGPEEEKICAFAEAELKRKENIRYRFAGSVRHEMLMEEYRSSEYDLFINVSASEGVPVSIMEALSFGIPVAATNVGGTSEILHDGINGWLLPKNFNNTKIAEIIREYSVMLTSQKKNLRSNARNLWKTEASSDAQFIKYEIEMNKMFSKATENR